MDFFKRCIYIGVTKRVRIIAVCMCCISLFSGCRVQSSGEKMISQTGFYFDTVITIQAATTQDTLIEAFEKCKYYEELLSKTVEGSDVWKINHAAGNSVEISPVTMEILLFAKKMSEETNGAFDITIAPASELWNFTDENPQIPSEMSIREAVSKIGYRQLTLNPATMTAPLEADASIDLGGIAKGFIADMVGAFLVEKDVRRAILNFGGNVVLIGEKEDGTTWKVGVQDPKKQTGEYVGVVSCGGGCSVVTSGTYERGFELDGVRYHHILDPATGYPVQNGLAGVTILASSSMVADAYSTACFVLGPDEGLAFAEQNPEIEAVFMLQSGEVLMTDGMKKIYASK